MTDKNDKLDAVVKELNKRYPEGGPMTGTQFLAEREKLKDMRSISTGLLTLDRLIGPVGGIPRGAVTIVAGAEASGKSTFTNHLIAEAQKEGVAALVEIERTFDPAWAAMNGVDVDALIIARPSTGEQAFTIVESLAESGQFVLIVLDSVAAMVPRGEYENEMGDAHMMLVARLMAQASRKLNPIISDTNTALVLVNQYRDDPSKPRMPGRPTPKIMPGGTAQRFWASLRIDLSRIGSKSTEDYSRVKAMVIKNKIGGKEYVFSEYNLVYGQGIDKLADLIDAAVEDNVIEQSGAWFKYGEEKYHGKDAVVDALRADDSLANEIWKAVLGEGD